MIERVAYTMVDEQEDEVVFLRSSRARQDYVCHNCDRPIEKGDWYERVSFPGGTTFKQHPYPCWEYES